jgi:hypothetical protein
MSLQSLLVLGKSYHIFETLVISWEQLWPLGNHCRLLPKAAISCEKLPFVEECSQIFWKVVMAWKKMSDLPESSHLSRNACSSKLSPRRYWKLSLFFSFQNHSSRLNCTNSHPSHFPSISPVSLSVIWLLVLSNQSIRWSVLS